MNDNRELTPEEARELVLANECFSMCVVQFYTDWPMLVLMCAN